MYVGGCRPCGSRAHKYTYTYTYFVPLVAQMLMPR